MLTTPEAEKAMVARTMFLTGRIGMYMRGNYELGNMLPEKPSFQIGVALVPKGPAGRRQFGQLDFNGIPEGSRAASESPFLNSDALTEDLVAKLRALNDIAAGRGQTLAQLALAWVLRGGRVTSALVGASSAQQIEDSVGALANLDFEDAELAQIDKIVNG